MRIHSEHDVDYVPLSRLRRFVPAAWREWAELQFEADGSLRDPDTGGSLDVLRLMSGRHRQPGAVYELRNDGDAARPVRAVLAADDGRAVQLQIGDAWWRADVVVGERPRATGSVAVREYLRSAKVPGCLIALIGARTATGSADVDLDALDRDGTVLRAEGSAQRLRGDLSVQLRRRGRTWRASLTAHVRGRGLLGHLAVLVGGPFVRKQLSKSFAEFWAEVDKEVAGLGTSLASVDAQVDAASGEDAWLHRELWKALREVERSTS